MISIPAAGRIPSQGRLFAVVDCGHTALKMGWVAVEGDWSRGGWGRATVDGPLPAPAALRSVAGKALDGVIGVVNDLLEASDDIRGRMAGLVLSVPSGLRLPLSGWLGSREELNDIPWWVPGPTDDWPVQNFYGTPATLGTDRLAAVTGALGLSGGAAPLVVVTAGTAITLNLVTGAGAASRNDLRPAFVGGRILPGYYAYLQGLGAAAPTLGAPVAEILAHSDWTGEDFGLRYPELAGETTAGNIRQGAMDGITGSVRANLRALEQSCIRGESGLPVPVWITGGDGEGLARELARGEECPDRLHHDANLVLKGLALAADRLGSGLRKAGGR